MIYLVKNLLPTTPLPKQGKFTNEKQLHFNIQVQWPSKKTNFFLLFFFLKNTFFGKLELENIVRIIMKTCVLGLQPHKDANVGNIIFQIKTKKSVILVHWLVVFALFVKMQLMRKKKRKM